jgi:peptidoglycan-associated lipoprotein
MRFKLLSVFAAVALLAACETASDQSASSTGTGASTGGASTTSRARTPQEILTSEVGDRVTREYNLALGERRANSAKNFLVSLGIDARRVATISYGKERPAVVGSNEAAWSQNRRAVMVVN